MIKRRLHGLLLFAKFTAYIMHRNKNSFKEVNNMKTFVKGTVNELVRATTISTGVWLGLFAACSICSGASTLTTFVTDKTISKTKELFNKKQ